MRIINDKDFPIPAVPSEFKPADILLLYHIHIYPEPPSNYASITVQNSIKLLLSRNLIENDKVSWFITTERGVELVKHLCNVARLK